MALGWIVYGSQAPNIAVISGNPHSSTGTESGSWRNRSEFTLSPDSVEKGEVLAGLTVVEIWGDASLIHVGAGVGANLASLRRF